MITAWMYMPMKEIITAILINVFFTETPVELAARFQVRFF